MQAVVNNGGRTRISWLFLAGLLAGLCIGCERGSAPRPEGNHALWYDAEEQSAANEKQPAAKESVAGASIGDVAGSGVSLAAERNANATPAEPQKYGIGVSLNDFRPFPDSDPWNQKIDAAPVDPQSDQILAFIGLNGHLHPDFGSGTWNGCKIGIPYVVVPGDQPRVTVKYQAYGEESDPGPYPLPFNTPVEGDPGDEGDRHAIVIDRDNWKLYELYRAFPVHGGASWIADSGAIFDLRTNTTRPRGWTSADAAGLPIFPGLVRYDEVGEQKEIRHALRFTLDQTRRAFVPPASHWASSDEHPLRPPLGMRVRLKASVPIEQYPESVRIILQCLKTYGMILADNGSDWFISGTPDERWNNDDLSTLRKIKASDLEILQMDGLVTPYSF